MSFETLDNFDLRTKKPLDKRSVTDLLANIELPYDGLIAFQELDEKFYKYKNGAWIGLIEDSFESILEFLNPTFSSKGEIFINVKDYGALGNGVADDTNAFNLACATGRTVFVPKGNYKITAPTNNGAWMLENGAKIIGLNDINSNGSLMNDTSRLTGRIFNMNVSDGLYGFRIGDTDPWMERDIRKATEIIAELSVLSSNGQIGLLTATRTSDNIEPNMAGIAHASYGINDNTTNPEVSYAFYLESRRSINAGTTFNCESDMVNYGETVDFNPYSIVGTDTGQCINQWYSAGGGSIIGANDLSAGIGFTSNIKQFRRGIVFHSGALSPLLNEALAMPFDGRVAWYDANGLKRYQFGDGNVAIRASDTTSESFLDSYYKKKGITSQATTASDIVKRESSFGYSGSADYLGAFTQSMQRTNFSGGNARFSYDITATNTAGVQKQVSLNGIEDNSFSPSSDNDLSLGLSYARWGQIFSGTGTISTSDQNLKQDITTLDDKLLNAFMSIEPKIFRFKDAVIEKGNSARHHMGYIAQELEQALIDQGLNPSDYAIWCKDEIMDLQTDKDGVVKTVPTGNYRYGLRYEHFIALMDASNRKRFSDMESRIVALEQKLNN